MRVVDHQLASLRIVGILVTAFSSTQYSEFVRISSLRPPVTWLSTGGWVARESTQQFDDAALLQRLYEHADGRHAIADLCLPPQRTAPPVETTPQTLKPAKRQNLCTELSRSVPQPSPSTDFHRTRLTAVPTNRRPASLARPQCVRKSCLFGALSGHHCTWHDESFNWRSCR